MTKSFKSQRSESVTGTPLHPLEKKIYIILKKYSRLIKNTNLVVAVSGGMDSVVALSVMTKLAKRLKVKVIVCHVDHGIRGRDSADDAQFVRKLACNNKLRCVALKLRGTNAKSGEAALRELRYAALFSVLKKFKGNFILTAHHKDDLLESRLMRLLQGTGNQGLKSMGVNSREGLLRPFIEIPRKDLTDYALAEKLEWRVDKTNSDTRYLRNWVRGVWLEVLRRDHPEYLPNLEKSLERLTITAEKKVGSTVSKRMRRIYPQDDDIYAYLRYHCEKRITSQHIIEFKKQLNAAKNDFAFHLAGVEWKVSKLWVEPTIMLDTRISR